MTPIRPMARVTELAAVSTIPVASACIGERASTAPDGTLGGAQVIWRYPATTKAIRMMAKNMPFMRSGSLCETFACGGTSACDHDRDAGKDDQCAGEIE